MLDTQSVQCYLNVSVLMQSSGQTTNIGSLNWWSLVTTETSTLTLSGVLLLFCILVSDILYFWYFHFSFRSILWCCWGYPSGYPYFFLSIFQHIVMSSAFSWCHCLMWLLIILWLLWCQFCYALWLRVAKRGTWLQSVVFYGFLHVKAATALF